MNVWLAALLLVSCGGDDGDCTLRCQANGDFTLNCKSGNGGPGNLGGGTILESNAYGQPTKTRAWSGCSTEPPQCSEGTTIDCTRTYDADGTLLSVRCASEGQQSGSLRCSCNIEYSGGSGTCAE